MIGLHSMLPKEVEVPPETPEDTVIKAVARLLRYNDIAPIEPNPYLTSSPMVEILGAVHHASLYGDSELLNAWQAVWNGYRDARNNYQRSQPPSTSRGRNIVGALRGL